ncbi:MAG: MFS transporter [Oscillospiraceae bacterium]|nr:MFS transporter [Oscillospiraceae bacterium]
MSKLFQQYRGLRRENYVLFFGNIVTNMGSMVWPMMTLLLDKKMGLSAGNIALLMMVWSFLCMPASLFGGRLADRINKKKIIIAGDTISVACYIICGLVPLSYVTVGLIMLASVFQSIEGPAYNALIADITPTRDREKAYSLLYLGGNIGLMISPTLAGMLFKNYLWLAFIISGVAIGCSTLLIWLFVRDIEPVREECEEAVYQRARENESVWRVLWDNQPDLLFTVITSLYFAAYNQFSFLMPLDLAAVHGDQGAVIFGTVTSLNCITVVVFTPVITKLFSKMRDTGKMVTGRILMFAGFLAFLLLLGFVPGYYIAMLIFTWGEVFDVLAEGPYVSTRIPASHRGRINGLMSVMYTAVTGGIDLAVGHTYDRAGSSWTWALVLGVTFVSVALTVILKRRDRKAYPKLYLGTETQEQAPAEGP